MRVMISVTIGSCQLPSATVRHYQIVSATFNYCRLLSVTTGTIQYYHVSTWMGQDITDLPLHPCHRRREPSSPNRHQVVSKIGISGRHSKRYFALFRLQAYACNMLQQRHSKS
jgi:hypothetical protein